MGGSWDSSDSPSPWIWGSGIWGLGIGNTWDLRGFKLKGNILVASILERYDYSKPRPCVGLCYIKYV